MNQKGTITVKCDLRQLIQLAATESATISVAVQMGLIRLLDKLASRASGINDPAAKDVLRLLCLEDILAVSHDGEQKEAHE